MQSDMQLSTSFYIMDAKEHRIADMNATMLYGFFFGAVLLLSLISWALGRGLNDPSYGYYSFFCICMFVFLASMDGWTDLVLSPYMTPFLADLSAKFRLIPCFAGLLFAMSFLDTKNKSPRMHMVMKSLVYSILALVVIMTVLDLPKYYEAFDVFELATTLTIVSSAIYLYVKNRERQVGIYLCGWIFMLTTFTPWFMANGGLIPFTLTVASLPVIGLLIEMIIMSVALHIRTGSLNQAKEKIDRVSKEKKHYAQLVMTLSHDLKNPCKLSN